MIFGGRENRKSLCGNGLKIYGIFEDSRIVQSLLVRKVKRQGTIDQRKGFLTRRTRRTRRASAAILRIFFGPIPAAILEASFYAVRRNCSIPQARWRKAKINLPTGFLRPFSTLRMQKKIFCGEKEDFA